MNVDITYFVFNLVAYYTLLFKSILIYPSRSKSATFTCALAPVAMELIAGLIIRVHMQQKNLTIGTLWPMMHI